VGASNGSRALLLERNSCCPRALLPRTAVAGRYVGESESGSNASSQIGLLSTPLDPVGSTVYCATCMAEPGVVELEDNIIDRVLLPFPRINAARRHRFYLTRWNKYVSFAKE
jgi:hypothetical protein